MEEGGELSDEGNGRCSTASTYETGDFRTYSLAYRSMVLRGGLLLHFPFRFLPLMPLPVLTLFLVEFISIHARIDSASFGLSKLSCSGWIDTHLAMGLVEGDMLCFWLLSALSRQSTSTQTNGSLFATSGTGSDCGVVDCNGLEPTFFPFVSSASSPLLTRSMASFISALVLLFVSIPLRLFLLRRSLRCMARTNFWIISARF
mmetsp:Transcript_30803/g.65147  ORF Transcript_30803/g.65147 Transcript_30803/m.65147 type:complete len:203 (+) Transcript_30803:1883-2491(+)